MNEDGFAEGEFFAFGQYSDQASFDADVENILQQTEEQSQDENLDFFLVVIDIVKQRAIEAGLEDESLFDFEGLFELGDQDAYAMHFYETDRLHDHLERTKDECWRLQVARVVDPQQKPLGWSHCVVFYPTLSVESTADEIDAAELAYILNSTIFAPITKRFSLSMVLSSLCSKTEGSRTPNMLLWITRRYLN